MPRFASEGTTIDLLRKGYWLFLPNPRGSYGQGAAFVDANRRDFGGGDLRDILAGIDAVEQQAPIDDNRLGLIGGRTEERRVGKEGGSVCRCGRSSLQ